MIYADLICVFTFLTSSLYSGAMPSHVVPSLNPHVTTLTPSQNRHRHRHNLFLRPLPPRCFPLNLVLLLPLHLSRRLPHHYRAPNGYAADAAITVLLRILAKRRRHPPHHPDRRRVFRDCLFHRLTMPPECLQWCCASGIGTRTHHCASHVDRLLRI